jgi:ABC-type lipoprotein release transport system permease subunit
MMLLRLKNVAGLVICTLVLSASVPMLLGIQQAPQTIFGGNMVAVSQVNASVSLNASIAQALKAQPNVSAASAEITCFGVIGDVPVLTRGVVLEDFLEIEGCHIARGEAADPNRFAVMGDRLAREVGLDVGDRFLLTGSSHSAIFQLEVSAIYGGDSPGDDLLVPLPYARKMAGLSASAVLFIRVKTSNQTQLVEALEEQESPVVVTTSGGAVTPVNVELTEEERAQQQLAIKYLDTAQFRASNGSYVSLFVREGGNSIKVVVGTFIALDGALAFIGSSAIVSRAIIERRREIGIISAIGADRGYLKRLIARDILLMSAVASALGVGIGWALARFIEAQGMIKMFGETIRAVLDPEILLGIFAASVIIHLFSGIIIENMLAGSNPRELLQETEKAAREAEAVPIGDVLEGGA